ncbi:ATP-binding protein [Streptomyces sp. NPDC057694]|uniref:ATP-binding protein n=1 Tax=Streptomyces sp. NPDC057694 TaxID=3346216 RepID=UPI00369381EF
MHSSTGRDSAANGGTLTPEGKRRARHDALCRRSPLKVTVERHTESAGGDLAEGDAQKPRQLRRLIRAALAYWGHPEAIETAQLLLTELVTNALQHSCGHSIAVCVSIADGRCVIEVNDGSPLRPELQHADLSAEDGRGLLLVKALSEAWGVSEDCTTTWCAFPLTEGPTDMNSAPATAPVLHEIRLKLPADRSAAGLARVQARYMLVSLGWPGNAHAAVDALHHLVDNAVQYGLDPGAAGQALSACLSITEAHELLIDVTDPNPTFADFDDAVAGERERGLWGIVRQGGELSWSANPDFTSKTVRAVLRPGLVDL